MNYIATPTRGYPGARRPGTAGKGPCPGCRTGSAHSRGESRWPRFCLAAGMPSTQSRCLDVRTASGLPEQATPRMSWRPDRLTVLLLFQLFAERWRIARKKWAWYVTRVSPADDSRHQWVQSQSEIPCNSAKSTFSVGPGSGSAVTYHARFFCAILHRSANTRNIHYFSFWKKSFKNPFISVTFSTFFRNSKTLSEM